MQPGYQKLCGSAALSFVRFRHTDSDLVRNARQQDFIRWAKDQYSQTQLIENRDKLVSIFGQHAQTDEDLHTTDGLINLFNLVAFMDGHTIKQIPFPAISCPAALVDRVTPAITGASAPGANATQTACYLTADPTAEQRAFNELMTPTVASRRRARAPLTPRAGGHRGTSEPSAPDLTADMADGKAQAAALGDARMPIYFPRLIAPGSAYCSSIAGNCYTELPSPGSYPRRTGFRTRADGGLRPTG